MAPSGNGVGVNINLLTRNDPVDGNKFWLDNLLQVGDFMFQKLVVVHQTVPVILDTDKIFETQGHTAPGMGFKFRQIDQEIGIDDRLGNEQLASQVFFALYFDRQPA